MAPASTGRSATPTSRRTTSSSRTTSAFRACPKGLPGLPDSHFQPAMALTCAETALRTRVQGEVRTDADAGPHGEPVTRRINKRQACHYCGPCEHGCVTHSYFNASFTTMADAMATGRCTLVTGAMVYKVLVDPSTRRARGVLYIDRATRQPREIFGRVVALCAQTQESVRILFNSATRQDPNGLANSSGLLGKGLMTHFSDAGAAGDLPEFSARPSLGGPHRPCWPLLVALPQHAGRAGQQGLPARLRLRHLRRQRRRPRGARVRRRPSSAPPPGRSPRASRCRASASACATRTTTSTSTRRRVDAFGIPVARIHLTPRANERAMQADMAVAAAEMLEAAGAKNVRQLNGMRGQAHEVGAARMGVGSEDVGAHAVPADARHRQPVRPGWLGVSVERLAEPDADDHGAGRARDRSHERTATTRRALIGLITDISDDNLDIDTHPPQA